MSLFIDLHNFFILNDFSLQYRPGQRRVLRGQRCDAVSMVNFPAARDFLEAHPTVCPAQQFLAVSTDHPEGKVRRIGNRNALGDIFHQGIQNPFAFFGPGESQAEPLLRPPAFSDVFGKSLVIFRMAFRVANGAATERHPAGASVFPEHLDFVAREVPRIKNRHPFSALFGVPIELLPDIPYFPFQLFRGIVSQDTGKGGIDFQKTSGRKAAEYPLLGVFKDRPVFFGFLFENSDSLVQFFAGGFSFHGSIALQESKNVNLSYHITD